MSIVVPQDVEEFVAHQIAAGRYESEDDVLRSAMQALAELDDDLLAIQDSLAEWRSGDAGVPLDEAIGQILSAGHRGTDR